MDDPRDKSNLPTNLAEMGAVVTVIGLILAWRESDPENPSAGALIAGVGVLLLVVGLVLILRRRR